MNKSVLQDWVCDLPFKQQTMLLSAIRGCDAAHKIDMTKPFIKKFRGAVLKNADESSPFMQMEISDEQRDKFCEALDPYPFHWVTHFMFASQIIGYKHPDFIIRNWWYDLYTDMVLAFHLKPETEHAMDERLSDNIGAE
jgi:hypothetical protein